MAEYLLDISINGHAFRMKFDTDLFSHNILLHSMMIKKEPYEKETVQAFIDILRQGDVFIDVGAHIGYFTLIAGNLVGKGGLVIAIEPDAENYRRLNEHIGTNKLACDSVRLQATASDVDGKTEFYLNADNDGGHALWPVGNHPFNEISTIQENKIIIQSITVDTLIRNVMGKRRVRLLKIDTEGAEVKVLRGAQKALSEHKIDYVIAELNDFGLDQMGASRRELVGMMRDFGYSAKILGGQDEGMECNILFYRGDKP